MNLTFIHDVPLKYLSEEKPMVWVTKWKNLRKSKFIKHGGNAKSMQQ